MNRETFLAKKEILLSIYDEIKNSDLIPISITVGSEKKQIKKEDIESLRSNLENERFILSICGQIKSGKSTLLNGLIFEDFVLPVDATPETAKLTILKYGETPKFIAHFYSSEDWDEIKKSEYAEYINKQIKDYSEEHEEIFYPEEYLNKKIEHTNLNLLRDYIGAKGKYTLMVKEVELFYPSDFLKEVTIVDTPGINDPNPARSKITKEWIDKSDAVIFLTYSGRAFDKEDKDFLDNYLFSVNKEKIIVAITKIDAVENYKNIIEYVKEAVKNSLGEDWYNILFKDKDVYPLAPLYYLYKKIAEKIDKNEINLNDLPEELVEDIRFQLSERVENEPWIEDIINNADKFMEDFKKGVIEHVIKSKGETILNSHVSKILSIFDKNIQILKLDIGERKDRISLLSKNKEETEKEKEKIKSLVKTFGKQERELELLTEKAKNDVFKIIKETLDEKLKKIERYVDVEDDISEIIHRLPFRIKDELEENYIEDLEKNLREYIRDFYKKDLSIPIEEFKEKTKDTVVENIISTNVDLFYIDMKSLENSIKDSISNITAKALEDLKSPKGVIGKFLNKISKWTLNKTILVDKEKTKYNIKEKIRKSFDKIRGGSSNNIGKSIEKFINKPIGEFVNIVDNHLRKAQKELEEVDKKKENVDIEIKKLRKEIDNLEKKLNIIETKKKQVIEKIDLREV